MLCEYCHAEIERSKYRNACGHCGAEIPLIERALKEYAALTRYEIDNMFCDCWESRADVRTIKTDVWGMRKIMDMYEGYTKLGDDMKFRLVQPITGSTVLIEPERDRKSSMSFLDANGIEVGVLRGYSVSC